MIRECSICGTLTEYLCADCAMDKKGYIPLCIKPECKDLHERLYCTKPDGSRLITKE